MDKNIPSLIAYPCEMTSIVFFYMELLVSDDKEMVIMMCLARFGLCSYSTQVMVFKMVSSNNLDLTRRIPGFVPGRHKLLWFHY